jgi:perosamine synthetase
LEKFIPISKPSITQREIDYVNKAVQSGWVSSLGEYIDLFEKEFANYCGTKYAVSTSNGTNALHLALVGLGINKDDEVIIPDLTFIATANSIKYIGAKVVTVDIQEDTLCIDPLEIEKAITSNTKAIVPVHLYGHPAEMNKIKEIAIKHNLFVIEDAAEAHGAEINGKKVGSLGDASIFSFYGNKIITSGEGGMITTSSKKLYYRLKNLRDHAMDKNKRYWHNQLGYNYRMTNLQAALGLAQFERIDEFLNKRKQIIDWYKNGLENIQGIRLNYEASWAKNVYWMVCLEIEGYTEEMRNNLCKKLKSKGIDSRPYFYPVSDMPMYLKVDTPVAHKVYKKGINLPSYFDLTKSQVYFICELIRRIFN